MNTRQIDCILELAQTQHFSRAAENLYMSQSTLTYQIKEVERELKFALFDRRGKRTALTPAGRQFCASLREIKHQLKKAIEQGQNFSRKYTDDITIGLPTRSCLYFLPEAMKEFATLYPHVSITPVFHDFYRPEEFLKGRQDIYFTFDHEMKNVPDTRLLPLYTSGIYLITKLGDILTKKKRVKIQDLQGRVLMVGGGSPPQLQAVQQRVIETLGINYFNSANHQTTLTNIAADKGVCLTPGFFQEYTEEFAWIPFDCEEKFSCQLCVHSTDKRPALQAFLDILQRIYQEKSKNYLM